MKTITLPAHKLHDPRRVLDGVLNSPLVKDGMAVPIDMREMRKRMKILDAVEASEGGEISLEDADYEFLQGLFNKFTFAVAHRDFVMLADAIDAAA